MNHNKKFSYQNFPQQTHFIGVLVPDELTETLENCRNFMNQKYGCKSGYGTPIHVTLVPPFYLESTHTTHELFDAIKNDVASDLQNLKFTANVEGFDAFGDRTIFAKVITNEKWTALRDRVLSAVLKAIPGCSKKDARPFQPHLTVANRDIPAGSSKDALLALNELNLKEDFEVDNITIFERHGGKWIAKASVEI